MPIKVALSHKTYYKYDRPVVMSPHVVRLRPAPHSRTPISAYSLKIKPEKHFLNWQQDPFGNYLARIVFPDMVTEFSVDVELNADLSVINPFDFFLEESAENFPFVYAEPLKKELTPYLEITEAGPLLKELLKEVDRKKQSTNTFLVYVNQLINRKLGYEIRLDAGVQSCETTLTRLIGSCRDFTWLMVQLFRHLGIAARFVSGYSVQLKLDEKPLEGAAGVSEDVTDLHAWVEVYVPGAGWIGLDGTSGLMATEGHIPLACTPDYGSAAPIEGYTSVCELDDFQFSNTVTRIFEDPRVTLPYTDAQWDAINALGEQVDADLKANDVRLTMGGEPTFVSIDDMESEQWNTAADGQEKRLKGWDLAKRLLKTFGSGGFLHHGQGKWYPGEPIPRWAYTVYWRKDGHPVWKNTALLASPHVPNSATVSVEAFSIKLAKALGVNPLNLCPAYEDVYYYLWEEGRLPVDVDPLASDLEDSLERQNIAHALNKGLNKPVGCVLPLQYNYKGVWESGPWQFRQDRLYLIPGNSPIGLRLPLKSLQTQGQEKAEPLIEQDFWNDLPNLSIKSLEEVAKGQGKLYTGALQYAIRTALSLEVRDGRMFIFFPPLPSLEAYLELLQAVEHVAAQTSCPVLIEGYESPYDWRMSKIVVAPDPGVLEINIHPSSSWKELTDNATKLFEQAKESRLSAEKFMTDGRRTGSGGGNHITLGAARPQDSPLLRRPDLLRSLITFWQHHPSLSYMFSSAFVGPTSQAPRIDEARMDKLYEMEIAFSQVPDAGGYIPPWLTDRLFRHLLTDLTGNTHRAEFCIDKLYSPDSSTGRLGILELRGFDMPPHIRMSLVQMLLIRSLVAWFWKEPYKKPLTRWGTELHDRFLLPHYCYRDMEDVAQSLQMAGYPFKAEWIDAFFEFRFPRYGTVQLGDIQLEVRMAIEPWHVLGEEMSSSGTSRFVDSSLERVQVRLTGITEGRHFLLCNNIRVPLHSTGIHGEFVCGVRYRAWQPPSALHPTLGVDAPLVFDLIDSWNGRSLGGCTYHVAHPGGRAYDTFPVNTYEADSRRINRFWDMGYAPAPIEVLPPTATAITLVKNPASNTARPIDFAPELVHPEMPYTLDMRLFKQIQ